MPLSQQPYNAQPAEAVRTLPGEVDSVHLERCSWKDTQLMGTPAEPTQHVLPTSPLHTQHLESPSRPQHPMISPSPVMLTTTPHVSQTPTLNGHSSQEALPGPTQVVLMPEMPKQVPLQSGSSETPSEASRPILLSQTSADNDMLLPTQPMTAANHPAQPPAQTQATVAEPSDSPARASTLPFDATASNDAAAHCISEQAANDSSSDTQRLPDTTATESAVKAAAQPQGFVCTLAAVSPTLQTAPSITESLKASSGAAVHAAAVTATLVLSPAGQQDTPTHSR